MGVTRGSALIPNVLGPWRCRVCTPGEIQVTRTRDIPQRPFGERSLSVCWDLSTRYGERTPATYRDITY